MILTKRPRRRSHRTAVNDTLTAARKLAAKCGLVEFMEVDG